MSSPYQIALSGDEQAVLAARARSVRGPYRDRLRAAIVLAAAAGQDNAAIARQLGVCTDTVRKWRRRFAEGRLAGLADAPRSGRPPVFTAADRAEVIALACALPAESGVPLSRWSGPDLARELARPLRHRHLGIHDPPVAGPRRPQALAAPVVDLGPRPAVRQQGRPGARPVCQDLGRSAAGPGRLCDLRR
jgi:transposase-like protein